MIVRDPRYDYRKGLALAFSQEVRDHYELANAANCRIGGEYGSIAKRAGTQRVHSSAIGSGATVLGMTQWKPSARELVAVSNGNVYYKAQADANFTAVSASLSTSNIPIFTRHVIAGTPTLFWTDGTLRKFTTGHSLSDVSGAPAGALFCRVYKGRMFVSDGTKTVYYSKVADPETWASPDGGQANADTYDAEGIVGMEVVGSSLLLFKENSIARFTGVSQTDIQVDSQTEGVAPDIGCIAPATICRIEDVVFFLSAQGPYIASEAGVQPVGVKIQSVFRGLARDYLSKAVAVYNKGRYEVWLFLPASGQTTNTVGYCMDIRQQAWTGPWTFTGFNPASACSFERTDLSQTVRLGGYDGFVRDGDVTTYGAKDDVLSDGTGGTAVTMTMELPTLFFGDPTMVKRMSRVQQVAADLKTNGSLVCTFTGDLMGSSQTATLASKGSGVKQYLMRPGTMGRRITLSMSDATSEIIQLNGTVLEADAQQRTV